MLVPYRCILHNAQGAVILLSAPDGIVILQTRVGLDSDPHNPKCFEDRVMFC